MKAEESEKPPRLFRTWIALALIPMGFAFSTAFAVLLLFGAYLLVRNGMVAAGWAR